MRFDRTSRRFFLTGAGAALALPFLSSLAPRGARAAPGERTVRYIQVMNPYGVTTQQFYGSLTPNQQIDTYVNVRPLAELTGDISALIGPELSQFKDKFSLLHGMDVIIENPNHHMCFSTCASGYDKGLDGDEYPPLSGQPSLDVLMANASAVYDSSTPTARRLLVLNPLKTDGYSDNRSFSWQATPGGKIEMVRPTKTTLGLMDILQGGFADQANQAPNEDTLLNAVHDDYRRVRDSSKISAEDRQRLEAYMSLINELSNQKAVCQAPTLGNEPDVDAIIDNQFKLLAAAMLCDLTRVASITLGMTEGSGVRHPEHHDKMHTSEAEGTGLYKDMVLVGKRVAKLLAALDAADEGDGTTLLDNGIVYWGMQYGNARPGDSHRPTNMPVLVAGGADGQLRTGYYIDYRKDGQLTDHDPRGVPINNLLVTLMNCMGLSSIDYEDGAKAGYGYYNSAFFDNTDRPNTAFWSSTDGRRSPLPFFYQGTKRG